MTALDKHSSFSFRQFDIAQDRCAMKVGTDGVLLGAWAAVDGVATACDIGAGSGLIALMLAQRTTYSQARITAIEIDHAAASQARENIGRSPWSDRVDMICGDAMQCYRSLPTMDVIVSNPPYFAHSLAAPDSARNQARHESGLGYESLIHIAAQTLSPTGRLCMISPRDRADDISWYSQLYKLPIQQRIDVSTVYGKTPSRTLWSLGRMDDTYIYSTEYIKDRNGAYSDWFRRLTKDFYL